MTSGVKRTVSIGLASEASAFQRSKETFRSEVRSVVCVENIWNSSDLPVGITFTPDTLAQSQARAQGFAPVNQIETFAVCLVAAVSQHQQPSWEVPHDPVNDRIAGLSLLKSLRHCARLTMYGTDR
jgi:hypothetical protein